MSDMADLAPRLFTVDEYHRIADAGLFADERVELLDGLIVSMSPIGQRHWRRHATISAYLNEAVRGAALIVPQGSFPLGNRNEPEPDIAVLSPHIDESTKVEPRQDIYAMIELSETSLAVDLGFKLRLYARFGVRDYLVVDLAANVLLHHSQPDDLGYRDVERLGPGATFALARVPEIVLRADPFLAP
ncbi:MAG TPA: Uma2 family endonuclease [Candidatus Sulfotelmatobacter sp.]|nr:Uma2 family endonuclease [Candidatus Sulfotelmatobacter sp.]